MRLQAQEAHRSQETPRSWGRGLGQPLPLGFQQGPALQAPRPGPSIRQHWGEPSLLSETSRLWDLPWPPGTLTPLPTLGIQPAGPAQHLLLGDRGDGTLSPRSVLWRHSSHTKDAMGALGTYRVRGA